MSNGRPLKPCSKNMPKNYPRREHKKRSQAEYLALLKRGDHPASDWCSRPAFLCANPEHWRWVRRRDDWYVDGNTRIGVTVVGYGHADPPRPAVYVATAFQHEDMGIVTIVEHAVLTQDKSALKALGVLAWNNPKYAEYKETVRKLYQVIYAKQ